MAADIDELLRQGAISARAMGRNRLAPDAADSAMSDAMAPQSSLAQPSPQNPDVDHLFRTIGALYAGHLPGARQQMAQNLPPAIGQGPGVQTPRITTGAGIDQLGYGMSDLQKWLLQREIQKSGQLNYGGPGR